MTHDTPDFEVRNIPRRLQESAKERGSLLPMGSAVVVDQLTAWGLQGYTYHMQNGTESAPVDSTTTIADTLVSMLADQAAADLVMAPLLYEVNIATVATATAWEAMLEVDKEKARWSSGGTAFVPEPLNGRDLNPFNDVAYVLAGAGIIALAKTAVPDSVELARKSYAEDAIATPTPGDFTHNAVVYSASNRPMAWSVGASSIVCHLGATTADVTAFSVLQFVQLPGSLIPSNS